LRLVVFVVVAVDERIHVVIHDGVGDEAAAFHFHRLEVEFCGVQDLVCVARYTRVDVDDQDLLAQRLLPYCLVRGKGLTKGVDVFGVRRVVFYGIEEGGNGVAQAGFRRSM
jgi:hypothetical protein